MENKSADAQGTGGPHAQQAGGPPAVAMQPLQQPQGVQPPHQQAGMAVAMYPQPQAGGPGPIGPPQPMQQPQGGQPPHQQAAVAVAMYPQPQAAFPQHGYGFVQQPYYHQQVYSPSPNAPAASSAQGAAHWPPNGQGHSPMPAGPSCSGVSHWPPTNMWHVGSSSNYSPASCSGVAVPPRRKAGRPLGSKNKRGRVEEPPAPRPEEPNEECDFGPELPEAVLSDREVPEDRGNACVNCSLYRGMFIVQPCGHYPTCYKCIAKEKEDAKKFGWREECFACDQTPTGYLRGFSREYHLDLDD
ncbi:synapsin-1-like [Thrips palmi]|uniref:Synapsin-1-like n=1 Tax=Thrips palmi TaxID=161013 RepID=A0A6P8YH86_THRPL|nr:synapsin-1-like [Thrips palmi]